MLAVRQPQFEVGRQWTGAMRSHLGATRNGGADVIAGDDIRCVVADVLDSENYYSLLRHSESSKRVKSGLLEGIISNDTPAPVGYF